MKAMQAPEDGNCSRTSSRMPMDTWLLVFLGQDQLVGTREERKKTQGPEP